MNVYRYSAKDRKGRRYTGIREAENEMQLVKALTEDGLYCYSIHNEDSAASVKHFNSSVKIAASSLQSDQFYVICRCSTGGDLKNSL